MSEYRVFFRYNRINFHVSERTYPFPNLLKSLYFNREINKLTFRKLRSILCNSCAAANLQSTQNAPKEKRSMVCKRDYCASVSSVVIGSF